MTHLTTCSCVGASKAIVGVPKLLKISSALRRLCGTCRTSSTNGSKRTGAYGCNTRSDPNSTAIVFQCIWCSFTAEVFVQQTAGSSFASLPSFDCSGFHHSTGGANASTVFDPSFGPKNLLYSNRQSLDDCWMSLQASTTLAHRTVPNENGVPSHFFRNVVSTNPRYMHVKDGTTNFTDQSSATTSIPKADSTASSAGHLQRTFHAYRHLNKPTSPP